MSLEEELAEDIVSETESVSHIEQTDGFAKPSRSQPQKVFIHDQIKSYIAILASALGGIDHTSEIQPPPYKLGDEALLCLQDIMKWLRTYDGASNSWEVAVACAESGLVNDLVRILCLWDDFSDLENETFSKISKDYDKKIANGSLKILEFLLRPIELKPGIFKDQLANYYTLKKYQLSYKKLLITYRNGLVFKAVIKLTLPVLSVISQHRKKTEHGLIRLVILFIRNFLQVEPMGNLKQYKRASKAVEISDNLPKGLRKEDIDIGSCIVCFEKNLVFPFLLTLCSTIHEELEVDILSELLLDIQFLLIKNLRPESIISANESNHDRNSKNPSDPAQKLSALLSKEKQMKTNFQNQISTRHGRFGTLLSLKTSEMGRLTVSNAGNLVNANKNPIKAFDRHKEWRMTSKFRYFTDEEVVFPEVNISQVAKIMLKGYVGDFIDGALNPFIKTLVKRLTAEEVSAGDYLPVELKVQYLLILSWFLEAHRLRADVLDGEYGLVGVIISEESLRLVRKFSEQSLEVKSPRLAHSALIAYTQIFHVINSMALSEVIDYRDTSRSLKERMFHKSESVDVIRDLVMEANKRNPQYVESCVELLDIMLNTLEKYSEENMSDVIIDKVSRKTKKIITKEQHFIDNFQVDSLITDLTENDKLRLKELADRLSKNRIDSFQKIQGRFIAPVIIDTYIQYFKGFRDLPEKNLKRALKYLHRVFFKAKQHVALYRLDFFHILHSMLSEDDGLLLKSSIRNHLNQFLINFMKQFRKNLKLSESLFVEILFPQKSRNMVSYGHVIETGKKLVKQDKAITVSKIIEIRGDFDTAEKISILVAALIDDDMLSLVEWIGEEMERIINLRILMEKRTADSNNNDDDDDTNNNAQPQELLPIIIKSIDPRQMRYLVTDPKLRYILKLAEFQLPQDSNQDCIYPITASLRNLTEITELVKLYQFTPVEFENGKKANEFLRVHSLERGLRERYANDDEEINEFLAVSDNESEEFFENAELRDVDEFGEASNDRDNDDDELRRNGLKKGVAKAKGRLVKREASEKKKSRKRRERHEALPMHELSDDEDHVRAPKKEVRAGFASSKYIVDSDDESDEENDREFFAREQKLRDFINLNGGVLTNDKLNEFLRSMADGKGATEGIEQSNKRDASKTLESPVTKRAKVRVVEDDQSNAELSSNDVNEPESGLSSDDEIEDKKNAEILKISTTRKARIIDDDEDDYDGLSDNEFQNSPASKSNTPLTDNEEVGDVQTNAKAVEYKNTGPLKIANDDEEEEVPTKRHKPKIIFDDDDDDDE